MDRRRKGHTSSGDSGMESKLLRHIFFRLFSYIYLFQEKKHDLNHKMLSKEPP